MKKDKRSLWIALIIWGALGIILFLSIDCQYVRPDIRLAGDPIGSLRDNGTVFICLCAVNVGGKTAHGVVANTTIINVGEYRNYLGTMRPGEPKGYEIDLPGVEWGKVLEVSAVFKWE